MPLLHQLPDDVLCVICEHTNLSTIFTLQLVCKSINDLIRIFFSSIAPAVAKNTFANTAPLLLRQPEKCDPVWLSRLIPRYLATVIVDRYRFSAVGSLALSAETGRKSGYAVPSTDESGDEFRERVASGFEVMMKLSLISKEVYCMPRGLIPGEYRKIKEAARKHSIPKVLSKLGTVKTKTYDSAVLREMFSEHHYAPRRKPKADKKEDSKHVHDIEHIEAVILHKRKEYLLSISQSDIDDFRLMFPVFAACFRTNRNGTPYPHKMKPDFFDWGGNCDHRGNRVDFGDSWVNWYILHEGPLVFWRQWCPPTVQDDDRNDLVKHQLLRLWEERGYRQIEAETSAVQDFERFLKTRCLVASTFGLRRGSTTDPVQYFKVYSMDANGVWRKDKREEEEEEGGEEESSREGAEEAEDLVVVETLNIIPYFIEFEEDTRNI